MRETRKLATILVADVVGHNRLAGVYEAIEWDVEHSWRFSPQRAGPLAARAEQGDRVATIGYLSLVTISPGAPWPNEAAFRAGLRDLGYSEGKNLRIEYRSTHGDESRLDELATELVRLNVDMIVTAYRGIYAAHRATTTIPIVMTGAGVSSLRASWTASRVPAATSRDWLLSLRRWWRSGLSS
jgi:hypothetical protein